MSGFLNGFFLGFILGAGAIGFFAYIQYKRNQRAKKG